MWFDHLYLKAEHATPLGYKHRTAFTAKPPILISLCGLLAVIMFSQNDRPIASIAEDLWVPSDSLSRKQERLVLSYFNDSEYVLARRFSGVTCRIWCLIS